MSKSEKAEMQRLIDENANLRYRLLDTERIQRRSVVIGSRWKRALLKIARIINGTSRKQSKTRK